MSSRVIAIAIQSNGYFVLGEEIFFLNHIFEYI